MRDILFKNLTSTNNQRRDIFLSEDFEVNGVITKTQKHFIYFIREHIFIDQPEELESWLKRQNCQGPRLKNLSVFKSFNSKLGEERFEVKIVGTLYILREQDMLNVDFTQIFKIERQGESLKVKSNIKN